MSGRLTELVTSYVKNCLLKQVIEGKIKGRWKWQEDEEEEDVRSCWMTLRTGEDTLI